LVGVESHLCGLTAKSLHCKLGRCFLHY